MKQGNLRKFLNSETFSIQAFAFSARLLAFAYTKFWIRS